MVYHKSDYIVVEYFSNQKLVKTKWLKYTPSAEYRKTLLLFLHLQKKYRIRKWLADFSDAKVVRPVDQQWTVEVWAPTFFSFPFTKYVAVVQPNDLFGKMSIDFIWNQISVAEFPIEVRCFEHEIDAIGWCNFV